MSDKPISSSASASSASVESKAAGGERQSLGASASSYSRTTPKEQIIKAIIEVLTHEFREGAAYENRVIYEEEAFMLASLVIQKLNLS